MNSEMSIAREEIFGLVLSVLPFTDDVEAAEIANDSDYGLAAGIFTSDIDRAMRFARDIQAGYVMINEYFTGGPGSPFGGYKQSGIGRERGLLALQNYYSKASGNNRAIWALGLRNPFKFAVQPATGTIFINDVGEDAWEEINRGQAGANYGWPVHEGVANDAPYVDPIFAYGHDGDPATPGCSITGGAFYNPATVQFPAEYKGDYFFAEFCGGWIRSLDPATGQASGFATGLERPVDLEVGEDGSLYYLTRAATAEVGKIRYAGN